MEETENVLIKLSLGEHEAKAYLALLDLGESTVTKLSERARLGRIHTYQIINKLIVAPLKNLLKIIL